MRIIMEHIIVSILMKNLDIQTILFQFLSSMAFVEIILANISYFPFSRTW